MTIEFNLGKKHKEMGYSIYYNPYRNKGTPQQFGDWVKGYNANTKAR